MWKIIVFLFLVLGSQHSLAQKRATILADSIRYSSDREELIATGNVEVFFQNYFLQTDEIRYQNGTIIAKNPITLADDNNTIILANFAQINHELQTSLLLGIKTLIDDRLQIAANNFESSGERYVLLRNALITTCKVCNINEAPIWHFKSRSVVLDREKQEIHMRDVDFIFGRFHLFSLPYLRLPDPSVKRKSGLLPPQYTVSSEQGVNIGVPYFQVINDYSDVTLTPVIGTKSLNRIEIEYRQLFSKGSIQLDSAVATSYKTTSKLRGFATLKGSYNLGNKFELSFSGTKVSDDKFLENFDFSDADNYSNQITVNRRNPRSYFESITTEIVYLKDLEDSFTLPRQVQRAYFRTLSSQPIIGGTIGLELEALLINRVFGNQENPRNIKRYSASIDWNRRWFNDNGLTFAAAAFVNANNYQINEEAVAFESKISHLFGTTAIDIGLPLIKRTNDVSDLLEPFIQFVWSPQSRTNLPPNEDSQLVEFDTTNLRSLDRFAGRDRNEEGFRINAGVKHTRTVIEKYNLELALGRVFRSSKTKQFTEGSGLSGSNSDTVASAELHLNNGIGLKQNLITDKKFDILQSISYFDYDTKKFGVGLGLTMINQDPGKGMTGDTKSVIADLKYRLNNTWTIKSDLSLDLKRQVDSFVGMGLEFVNQCFNFSSKIERGFSTDEVPNPEDKFSLLFSFAGISGSLLQSTSTCSGG